MAKQRYLEINGKEIEVSEEVYKEYMKPIWREKKRIQRAYKNLEELQDKDRIKSVAENNGCWMPLKMEKISIAEWHRGCLKCQLKSME